MEKIIMKILRWVARLGQRAQAAIVEEILLHHGFEYAPSMGAWCDPIERRKQYALEENTWQRHRFSDGGGFEYVHLGFPGVDEKVFIWVVEDLMEWDDHSKLEKVLLSDLDAVLARRNGTPRYI